MVALTIGLVVRPAHTTKRARPGDRAGFVVPGSVLLELRGEVAGRAPVVVRRPPLGEHPRERDERAARDRPGDRLAHLDVGVGGVLRRVLAGRGAPAGVEGLL